MKHAVAVEPSVSLVVCTRNRAACLPSMLDSLEALIATDLLEVIFVDNGSTDNTSRILQDHQARTSLPMRIVSELRPGLSRARNAGIAAARGAIVAFTDDDCYPVPGFISALVRIFRENDVDIVGGPLVLHDPRDHWVSTTRAPGKWMTSGGGVIIPGDVAGGCMAFRRAVFTSAGPFDPELGAGTRFPIEDAEMVARACLVGHPVGFFMEPVVRHHHKRRCRKAGEALARRFAYGRGAFWAKMLLEFRDHRSLLLRHWYWMLYSAIRDARLAGVRENLHEFAGALHYLARPRRRVVRRGLRRLGRSTRSGALAIARGLNPGR